MNIDWNEATDTDGGATREFRISDDDRRDITGAVWLPTESSVSTLVCFGHGASGDRYQAPIAHLAARFVERGLPVLSLDGPVHGLRQVGPGGREAFFPEFQRNACITDMISDWALAVQAAQGLANVGTGALAYFGLSMGSLFGIPLIASRDDVTVATLGLVGIQSGFPHTGTLREACGRIHCPVFFIMQLEDELFDREGYLEVFDTFPSVDKRIHANPGLHPEIPAEEIDFAFDFLISHIEGTAQRRIVNPLAE
ncbi:MAG: hypothetical protein QF921_09010 [Pseudomonadales bacterium]|nr:hypothetical protein [Pseudomonadales bacterium]MDP6471149.1 hypothetical protein [Pseudomonadales bacterium]MDP6825664.1 hypothetical protein [Pseudomonadales bacterium]MDP6971633.1 hypothetical protein [Pseudomonadales bacterium]